MGPRHASLGLLASLGLVGALVACETTSASVATDVDAGPSIDAAIGDGGSIEVTPDILAARGACPAVTGEGTKHDAKITADETWTAAGSPHVIPYGNLQIFATVTIEPCAVVALEEGAFIQVGSTTDPGAIVAHGTATAAGGVRPVNFTAADATKPWTQIDVEAKGTIDLAIAAIQNGGVEPASQAGALLARGVAGGTNDGEPVKNVKVDRVLVEKSATYGVNMEAWSAFADGSKSLWIRGSGSAKYPYPIRIEPGVVASLPDPLVVSGNPKDEILLSTSKTFMRDDTFVNRGIPYHQLGMLYVSGAADGSPVTLTIEPGVTVAFETDAGSGVRVGSSYTRQGVLKAVGTEAAPITFTSAKDAKAAGDWMSLYFHATTDASRVSYAKVLYAGADSTTSGFGCGPGDNDGAVFVGGLNGDGKAPAGAFIDHTSFDQIAGTTVIVSGWISDSGPDMSPTNTFGAATPGCKVSQPRRSGAGDVCDGNRTTCRP